MRLPCTVTAAAFACTALTSTAGAADLRMSWWGDDSRNVATQEALAACGDKNGHIIQPEFTGWSGHLEKVTTQIAGGTEADIMQINWPWLPLFSTDGEGFADLREYSDIIDLSQWTDAQLVTATMNGRLNGLPLSTTGRVFLFNKTTFEKAGLEVPRSWADLRAAAPVLKEKLGDHVYPFDAVGLNALLIVSLVATQRTGEDLVDPKTNSVAWSEEELADALRFYQALVDERVIQSWRDAAGESSDGLIENPRWASGEIAGTYEWDSTYFKYADPLQEGQELVPVGLLTVEGAKTQGVYRKPSMLFSISKNSANPRAAAEILNCLLNEPEGISAMGEARGLPASKVAAATLLESGTIDPTLVEANEIVMQADGPSVSPVNEHPESRAVFENSLELFAYGELTAEEAAQDIISGINDVLDNYR